MTENEKNAFEQELREKIAEEKRAAQRAYKAKWRANNREHIRQYNKIYRVRQKLCKGVRSDGER